MNALFDTLPALSVMLPLARNTIEPNAVGTRPGFPLLAFDVPNGKQMPVVLSSIAASSGKTHWFLAKAFLRNSSFPKRKILHFARGRKLVIGKLLAQGLGLCYNIFKIRNNK